jgi:hypothetical protein
LGAASFEGGAAFEAELRLIRIVVIAGRTLHRSHSRADGNRISIAAA